LPPILAHRELTRYLEIEYEKKLLGYFDWRLNAKQKKAKYIYKNNELIQEFRFAHPDSLLRINQIYKTVFTG
jgi:hypothetical protein